MKQSALWEQDSASSSFGGAVIIEGYRYTLWRSWNSGQPRAVFIMLNPSDGNQVKNDPTLRRCIGFAKTWHMGSIEVVNLFAHISPDPDTLKRATEPVGVENDSYIQQAVARAALIVCAWGGCKHIGKRDLDVLRLLNGREVYCLGCTMGGFPRHPLYLAHETPLIRYAQGGKNS